MASEETGDSEDSISTYVVKCANCEKWRVIPSKEEYETIRDNILENLWSCEQKPGVSCDDPADIEYNSSQIWVKDKPSVPKPPPSTQRIVTLRQDLSRMDTCYLLPNGKRASCTRDVEQFLEEFPEHKDGMSVSSFDFDAPVILEETVSKSSEKVSAARAKKSKAEASNNTARTKTAKARPSASARRTRSAAKAKSAKAVSPDDRAETRSE